MKGNVLIVDDDRKLGRLLTDYLAGFGFKATAVAHPDDAMRALRQAPPDIVILDVMLPDRDGFEVCREIRRDFAVPIIMLTARGEITDRVLGLELGADDYLPKPFEPRELVARIQSVLRRGAGAPAPDRLRHGRLLLDFHRREATLGGGPLDLTGMEFEVLALFARSPGKVLDRDRIMERIKGLDWEPANRSIDVLVSRLREKLGDDPRRPTFLKTVRGAGYMYIGGEDMDAEEARMRHEAPVGPQPFLQAPAGASGRRRAGERLRGRLLPHDVLAPLPRGHAAEPLPLRRSSWPGRLGRRRTRPRRAPLARERFLAFRYEGPGGAWATAPGLEGLPESGHRFRESPAGGNAMGWSRGRYYVQVERAGARFLFATDFHNPVGVRWPSVLALILASYRSSW